MPPKGQRARSLVPHGGGTLTAFLFFSGTTKNQEEEEKYQKEALVRRCK